MTFLHITHGRLRRANSPHLGVHVPYQSLLSLSATMDRSISRLATRPLPVLPLPRDPSAARLRQRILFGTGIPALSVARAVAVPQLRRRLTRAKWRLAQREGPVLVKWSGRRRDQRRRRLSRMPVSPKLVTRGVYTIRPRRAPSLNAPGIAWRATRTTRLLSQRKSRQVC